MLQTLEHPIDELLRELAPQMLGAVVRRFRDFAAAEDAVQEALIAAAGQWPQDGLPENPRGWLIQVASRRMADQIRSEAARRHREQVAAEEAVTRHHAILCPQTDSAFGAGLPWVILANMR